MVNGMGNTQHAQGWDFVNELSKSCLRILGIDLRGNLDVHHPVHPTRDREGEASYRVLHVAQEEEVKEEPANDFHQLLVVVVFTLINTFLTTYKNYAENVNEESRPFPQELPSSEDLLLINEV